MQLLGELVAVPAHTSTPRLAKAEHFLLLGDWADSYPFVRKQRRKEWFLIYNTTPRALQREQVQLNGLVRVTAPLPSSH